MMKKLPPALKKGDTIGIMAPSSRVDHKNLDEAMAVLQKLGFNIYVHAQTFKKDGLFAGTPREKADAFHDLVKNPAIRAIMCARGGNGATYMLPHLNYKLIRDNPKIVLGFSDVTALLLALHKETGLIGFHGPTASLLPLGRPAKKQLKQCFSLLSGEAPAPIPLTKASALRTGTAHGRLIGGNLSLISALIGTKWQPDTRGALLFLEDVGDEISRIDRMLLHARNAGLFDQAAGIIFGGFTSLTDSGRIAFGFTLRERLQAHTAGLKIPVVMNAPVGHGKDLYTFPVGVPATLGVRKDRSVLTLDGPAVKV